MGRIYAGKITLSSKLLGDLLKLPDNVHVYGIQTILENNTHEIFVNSDSPSELTYEVTEGMNIPNVVFGYEAVLEDNKVFLNKLREAYLKLHEIFGGDTNEN